MALKSEPIIKYRLDFGVLPAAVTTVITSPIINFIEMMVNTVAVPMLLWPNRITVSQQLVAAQLQASPLCLCGIRLATIGSAWASA